VGRGNKATRNIGVLNRGAIPGRSKQSNSNRRTWLLGGGKVDHRKILRRGGQPTGIGEILKYGPISESENCKTGLKMRRELLKDLKYHLIYNPGSREVSRTKQIENTFVVKDLAWGTGL